MEKVIFTNMTKQDLETIIIDCVLVCLKGHDRKEQLKKDEKPKPPKIKQPTSSPKN